MFLPPHRSLAPSRALRRVPRWMRALLLLGFLALGGVASAQFVDPNCPPTAWCHPDGSGLSYIEDAASEVGADLVRRRETGDCTGLGPEGCLGVVLNQLMCVIDGRDWVQQYACAPGPVETPPAGGGGGGGGGATPPTETPAPPAEEKPEPDPDAEPLAAVSSPRLGQWLRGELDRTSAGERLARLRIGDRGYLDLLVWGRYERERGASSYFALVRALDSVDRRERLLIVGVRGDFVYIGDVERLRAGSRGGAAPTPFGDVLAQGGFR